MLRYIPYPLHSRLFVDRIWLACANINLTRDGLMDDSLFLFFKELKEFLLGLYVAMKKSFKVDEKTNDVGLIRDRREKSF